MRQGAFIIALLTTLLGVPLAVQEQQESNRVFTNAGVFTNTRANLNVVSNIGNTPIPIIDLIAPGRGFGTDAISAAITAPSTLPPTPETATNINGVAAYVQSGCDSRRRGRDRLGCNAVAFYSQSVATGDHAAVWGFNPVVTDNGTPNANLTGIEVDIGSNTNPYSMTGITVEAGGSGTAPTGSEYYLAHYYGANFKPAYGFVVDRSATTSGGIVLDGRKLGGDTSSQGILFLGYDYSGARHAASISANPDGTLVSQNSGGSTYPVTQTVGSGTVSVGMTDIAPGRCDAVATAPALGVRGTDSISWSFSVVPGPGWSSLTVQTFPTYDAVNFVVCNHGTSDVTPAPAILNWRVVR